MEENGSTPHKEERASSGMVRVSFAKDVTLHCYDKRRPTVERFSAADGEMTCAAWNKTRRQSAKSLDADEPANRLESAPIIRVSVLERGVVCYSSVRRVRSPITGATSGDSSSGGGGCGCVKSGEIPEGSSRSTR